MKSIDARLAEFDQKLDGLDKRAGAMTGSEKNDFKNQIDRLRTERKDVDNKLGDLKKVDVESWTTMKSGVDSAMASLERSYMDVSQRYKNLPETSNTPGTPKTRTY